MPLMTLFDHSQFHYSILMDVGQINPDTFPNPNHDPLPLQVQKSNSMKYDTQTKMISYDLAHTR